MGHSEDDAVHKIPHKMKTHRQNKLKFSVLVWFTILYRTRYKKIDVRLVQCPFNRSGLYDGQKCFFGCIIFGTVLLYSIQPISTWNNKIFGLGPKKKVCSALLWHFTFFLWWEWIWVKNPLRTSFSGMLLWFYCLIKWAQNTQFWNFQENWPLRFRKKLHFVSKFSRRTLFTICRKFCFIRYFKVYSCKDNYMCYLLKKFEHFITSSLSVALIWMFLQCSYSNAWGQQTFLMYNSMVASKWMF